LAYKNTKNTFSVPSQDSIHSRQSNQYIGERTEILMKHVNVLHTQLPTKNLRP
jgi:hypothetical protein